MISNDEFFFLASNLLKRPYRFAKTMPEHPHWYTLRREWVNEDDTWVKVVEMIREHGYKEMFKRTKYTLFNVNGMKYWTMGAPIPITILINRTHQTEPAPYNFIADKYENLFHDPASVEEDETLIYDILDARGKMLDIGCGTGLLLDYLKVGADYTGIDPSSEMLSRLKVKHPAFASRVIHTKFEDFYGTNYDTIFALYGTASYIDPNVIDRVKHFLAPGGKAFLMYYKDGYTPKTHIETGISIPFNPAPDVDGIIFNNYKIVTIVK